MNRITELFGIRYPVVQGGMIWCSGWKLAAAVSNAGGLGLIGSGSMDPDLLTEHIRKCRSATNKPFGVNIPLLFGHSEAFIRMCISEQVPAVFTSAGNPVKYTKLLQENGIRVAHVVANTKGALKCAEAGVDAIVAEGFEAGGHNGREETTTLVLIPLVRKVVQLPLIAAGGIATGRGMLAAMALGAKGVQIGSRFAASEESSAHPSFKQKIVEASEGDTMLSLKKLVPVRLLKNDFFRKVNELEDNGAPASELEALLGKGRAGLGMFDGNMQEGELEIGQASALIREIKPVSDIMEEIITEYRYALQHLPEREF
jgi:enoyl-[acyl-carrier protein] reductase II